MSGKRKKDNEIVTDFYLTVGLSIGIDMPKNKRSILRILAMLVVFSALLATTAIAGVNEDFLNAAHSGNLPAVKRFIAKGADVNAKANNGETALTIAAQQGHKAVEKLLIRGHRAQ